MMKNLLIFMAIGLVTAEKLDRTYLPPPGSKLSGGSPGAIQIPLEYPKETYSTSTTARPQLNDETSFEDYQTNINGARDQPSKNINQSHEYTSSHVTGSPGNMQKFFNSPPTSSTLPFSQTTSNPRINIVESTGSPILGPSKALNSQKSVTRYPEQINEDRVYKQNYPNEVTRNRSKDVNRYYQGYERPSSTILPTSVQQQNYDNPHVGRFKTNQSRTGSFNNFDNNIPSSHPIDYSGEQENVQKILSPINNQKHLSTPASQNNRQQTLNTDKLKSNDQDKDINYDRINNKKSQKPISTIAPYVASSQSTSTEPIIKNKIGLRPTEIYPYGDNVSSTPKYLDSQNLDKTSTTEIRTRPERPQAEAERNAVILNYENVITPEGYAYSYDTSNGIHADESASTIDGVKAQGSYSYTGDDGKIYSVVYSADKNGFQPRGDHLPTPPPIPDAILKVIEQTTREKEAGIFDDGSYDDSKYGHLNYDGFINKYNPQQKTKFNERITSNKPDYPSNNKEIYKGEDDFTLDYGEYQSGISNDNIDEDKFVDESNEKINKFRRPITQHISKLGPEEYKNLVVQNGYRKPITKVITESQLEDKKPVSNKSFKKYEYSKSRRPVQELEAFNPNNSDETENYSLTKLDDVSSEQEDKFYETDGDDADDNFLQNSRVPNISKPITSNFKKNMRPLGHKQKQGDRIRAGTPKAKAVQKDFRESNEYNNDDLQKPSQGSYLQSKTNSRTRKPEQKTGYATQSRLTGKRPFKNNFVVVDDNQEEITDKESGYRYTPPKNRLEQSTSIYPNQKTKVTELYVPRTSTSKKYFDQPDVNGAYETTPVSEIEYTKVYEPYQQKKIPRPNLSESGQETEITENSKVIDSDNGDSANNYRIQIGSERLTPTDIPKSKYPTRIGNTRHPYRQQIKLSTSRPQYHEQYIQNEKGVPHGVNQKEFLGSGLIEKNVYPGHFISSTLAPLENSEIFDSTESDLEEPQYSTTYKTMDSSTPVYYKEKDTLAPVYGYEVSTDARIPSNADFSGSYKIPSTTFRPNTYTNKIESTSSEGIPASKSEQSISHTEKYYEPGYTSVESQTESDVLFPSTYPDQNSEFIPTQYPDVSVTDDDDQNRTRTSFRKPIYRLRGSEAERTTGEDFSGPQRPQSYDPETGYHY